MTKTKRNYSHMRLAFSCLLVILCFSVTNAQTVPTPDGYAEGTTGGGNSTPQTVSSASEFKSLADGDDPVVIIVDGRLDVGDVSVGSNKTIMGKDANAGLYGGVVKVREDNCIFQNLTIGPSGDDDAMELSGATKVFIHKCEFYDGADGSLDIVRQADYITVSWCKFYYVNQTTHKNTILIGNGDDVTADEGKLHVTMHHNWFAEKCHERMPRVRFGHVHIYNNYYNSTDNLYCIGTGVHCRIRVENSHFDNINNPWRDYNGMDNDGKIGWAGIKFTNGASQPSYAPNSFPVFDPPYSYSMYPVDEVKDLVRAGAGNVFSPSGNTPHGDITPPLDNVVINLNTVYSKLTLVRNGSQPGSMRVAIYNSLGKLVMAENVNEKEDILDISHISKGFYFISLESNRGNMTRKIFIE